MFEFLEEKRKKKNANQVRTAGIIHQFHYDFGKAGEQERSEERRVGKEC